MAIEAKKLLGFANGKLTKKTGVPAWFRKAEASEEQDWQKCLKDQGAEVVESFGSGGDTFHIYRTPTGGYMVEVFDVFYAVAYIFIDEVYDYLRFRVEWLKPLVELSEHADLKAREEVQAQRA